MESTLYSIVVIAGPILLGAILLSVILGNRRAKGSKALTEEATRRRREEGDR